MPSRINSVSADPLIGTSLQREKVFYARLITHITTIMLLPLILLWYTQKDWLQFSMTLIGLFGVNVSYHLIFKQLHRFTLARNAALMSGYISVLATSLMQDPRIHDSNFFFVLTATAFLLFKPDEWFWSSFWTIFLGISYVIVPFIQRGFVHDHFVSVDVSQLLINDLFSFLFIALVLRAINKSYGDALREDHIQKKAWENLSEASPSAIFKMDSNFKMVYFNEQFQHLFEKQIMELNIVNLRDVFDSDAMKSIVEWMARESNDTLHVSLYFNRGLSHEKWCHLYMRKTLIKLNQNEYIGVINDITALKKLEIINFENEKNASIGKLAGLMAHEINNPMSIIQLQMDFLTMKAKKEPLSFRIVHVASQKVTEIIKRIGKITYALRLIAQDDQLSQYEILNIREFVETHLRKSLEENGMLEVNVNFIDHTRDSNIRVDKENLAMVLENLFSNSVRTIKGQTEPWIQIQLSYCNDDFILKIQDSGMLDSGFAKRFKEPIVVEKTVGKEFGLGLSIAKSLVIKMGGILSFNEKSAVTEFILSLPKNGASFQQKVSSKLED